MTAPRYRVLVVCTGNICRSPMAEVVLTERFDEAGLGDAVAVDSAGISAEESGNPIDRRAQRVLVEAGYAAPRRAARQVTRSDAQHYDLALAMTQAHARGLLRAGFSPSQVALYRAFEPGRTDAVAVPDGVTLAGNDGLVGDVPDPWYGSMPDFVECLATVEECAPGIVAWVEERLTPVGGAQ